MSARTLVALAVALPLVVMAGWVAKLEYAARTGAEVELKVVAYDPRDLLAGHYLTYRVDYGREVCPARQSGEACVCFGPAPAGAGPRKPETATWSGSCEALPADCGRHLRGACTYGRFTAGIERYYLSEAAAKELARVPDDASILVRVSDAGSGLVRELRVGGRPRGGR